ncbi:MAG: glycosyltransferase family 2 protein [Spirochaetota bacterium]
MVNVFLSVVFVTHGGRIEVVRRFLESITGYQSEEWVEFICIDNGSDPPAFRLIHNDYPFVTVIKNNENLGTSRAYNAGIRAATGKYVLILNDDTVIPDGMLDKIKAFLHAHPTLDGIALGLKKDKKNFQALRLRIINFKKSHPDKVKRATFVGTGNLLIKKEVMQQVDLYDENYFAGNEDMDLSFRLKKAGIEIYYIPQLYIYHLHVYRKKKSSWAEFTLARRLSDVYFAKKFFPFLVIFVKRYAFRSFKKKAGKVLSKDALQKAKEIISLDLDSYYEVQKSLLNKGIIQTYQKYVLNTRH